MKRKYTMTRIYEPLYSKLKAEAAKKGVHVSVLVNEKLTPLHCFTCDDDIKDGCQYHVYQNKEADLTP